MYISDKKTDENLESEKELRDKLGVLHRRVNELEIPVIIVFEGWYDSLIAEVINRQIQAFDPRGYDFYYTQFPTRTELQKPFMWRFMEKIPPRGKLAMFDRSWYIRGLLEYIPLYEYRRDCLLKYTDDFNWVEEGVKKGLNSTKKIDPKELHKTKPYKSLVQQINLFERNVAQDGYVFIKIFLGMKPEDRESIKKVKKERKGFFDQENKRKAIEKIYYEDLEVFKTLAYDTDTAHAPWNIIFLTEDIDITVRETMKVISNRLEEAIEMKEKDVSPRGVKTAVFNYDLIETPTLDEVDLSPSYKKKEYKEELEKSQKELERLHYLMNQEMISMVCVFEGWDAAGKGGCIRRATRAMNPRLYRVVPIGTPSEDDLKYHYIYRFLNGIPDCGRMTIYDRSWYGRVMVERVEGFATTEEWYCAYDEINSFEKMLTSFGVIVIKFWLHIDKDKQYERFIERKNNPIKQWKLTDDDWRNREKWDEYHLAVNEMIEKTSTEKAPWIIIPANDQRYARVQVIKEMNKAIKNAIEMK